jgi:hypothetical protein
MALKQELLDAYLKAHYVVFGTPDFTFRIGRPCVRLDALLEAEGAAGAAFITAANPHGKRRSDAENHAAFLSFSAAMSKTPYTCRPGVGRNPVGNWAEASLLIIGIPRAKAAALGRSLGQNAIVYAKKGKAPELAALV